MALKKMENKELSLEDLDQVAGGVISDISMWHWIQVWDENTGVASASGAFPYTPGDDASYQLAVAKATIYAIENGFTYKWVDL